MSDSATTVSQADVARLADVTRAAVSLWRKRHADFPMPVGGTGDQFLLGDVIGWLDRRAIPIHHRESGEAADATYGGRARRRPPQIVERSDGHPFLRSLQSLGPEVGVHSSRSDYLYLLVCLAFLRSYDRKGWTRLIRNIPAHGDSAQARGLLRRVVATVDESLGCPHLLSASDAPPARLRPRAFEPVRKVFELSAQLRPGDFERLRSTFLRQVRPSDAIHTPPSIARTMAALLVRHTTQGEATVYDPFVRFGELPAEFVSRYAHPAGMRVRIAHTNPVELRLAGMWLVATGAPADLNVSSSAPSGRATFLLTNPPFGDRKESAWLRDCTASLTDDGRAAVLMPYSAGFAAGRRAYSIRQELVEQGAVLAVIALPAQMFPGSSIGVCIWLLRHPTGQPTPVRLVDARRLGKLSDDQALDVRVIGAADIEKIVTTATKTEHRGELGVLVTPDEIRAHGYSLHPPEYQDRASIRAPAGKALAELDGLLAGPALRQYTAGNDDGWPRRRLGDLCAISMGIPHRPLKELLSRAPTTDTPVPIIHPRHLRHGFIDADDAPETDAAIAPQRHRLAAGDVLLVRTGAMGQTALVRGHESGWLPHTNLLRLRILRQDELDPSYLLMYLSQMAVQARIRDRSIRSVTTSLSIATLGDLEMPLPPPADQQRILVALQALDEETTEIERRLAATRAARTVLGRHLTDGTVVLAGRKTR
ncbi:N-6 DNA methylase [Micromonospora wenchangensis]